MSPLPRFLFDECIGKPMMLTLHRLVMPDAEFVHICDHFRSGVKDQDWVPLLAADGNWVVITSDGGMTSKRRERLPDICVEYCVTHVVLSRSLHKMTSHFKATAVAQLWSDVACLHKDPPGTRGKIRYQSLKKKNGLVLMFEKEIPSHREPSPSQETPDAEPRPPLKDPPTE